MKFPTYEDKDGTNLAEVGTDCISREQAIKTVGWYSCHSGDKLLFADNALRQLPPIQPDIVRCKDCKHWMPYDWMFSEVWQSQNIDDYPEDEISCNYCDMHMKSSDFCSQAVRREVQDENDKTTNNTTNA